MGGANLGEALCHVDQDDEIDHQCHHEATRNFAGDGVHVVENSNQNENGDGVQRNSQRSNQLIKKSEAAENKTHGNAEDCADDETNERISARHRSGLKDSRSILHKLLGNL